MAATSALHVDTSDSVGEGQPSGGAQRVADWHHNHLTSGFTLLQFEVVSNNIRSPFGGSSDCASSDATGQAVMESGYVLEIIEEQGSAVAHQLAGR